MKTLIIPLAGLIFVASSVQSQNATNFDSQIKIAASEVSSRAIFKKYIEDSDLFVHCLKDTLMPETRGFFSWLGFGQDGIATNIIEDSLFSQLFKKFPFDQLIVQVKTCALKDCLQDMQSLHDFKKLFSYWDALKQFDFSNTNDNQENALFYAVFAQDLANITQLNPAMTDIERSSILAYTMLKDFLCVLAVIYQHCSNTALIDVDSSTFISFTQLIESQNIPFGDQADPVIASYVMISSLPLDQIVDLMNKFIDLFSQSIERLALQQNPESKTFSLIDWVKGRIALSTMYVGVFLMKVSEYFNSKGSSSTPQE